jgi:release factor glutamine methyltransferase
VQATALLAHALGLDRAQLLARLRDPLATADVATFEHLVDRRTAHEPLQYIVGRAHFLDFAVHVEPGVFIPRPETEQLVETALAAWDPTHELAIDLCCGSGAIAVALARARPSARVVAIDRAPRPRQATRRNAQDLGTADRITVVGSDLLAAFRGAPEALGVIVCNPPYAASGEVVQPEVRDYEPSLAWESGPVGTEIYARVIPEAARLLVAGRPLLFELGFGQADAITALLAADGHWERVVIDNDFQDIPRVLTAYRR